MKNMIRLMLFSAFIFIAADASAQKKDSIGNKMERTANKIGRATKKVGRETGRTAKKVGNKTAEVASKGASKVSDKTFDGKAGPNGETIYIDKNSYYYYVNSKGRHVYVKEADLKDKPKN